MVLSISFNLLQTKINKILSIWKESRLRKYHTFIIAIQASVLYIPNTKKIPVLKALYWNLIQKSRMKDNFSSFMSVLHMYFAIITVWILLKMWLWYFCLQWVKTPVAKMVGKNNEQKCLNLLVLWHRSELLALNFSVSFKEIIYYGLLGLVAQWIS